MLQELLILSASLKSNQSEVNELFFNTIQHVVNDFVSEANESSSPSSTATHIVAPEETTSSYNTSNGTNTSNISGLKETSRLYYKSLKILRTLASSGPGNIHAAQKLSIAATGIYLLLLYYYYIIINYYYLLVIN